MAFLFLFAIAGLQLWMGSFRQQCLEVDTGISNGLCGVQSCPIGSSCAATNVNPQHNTISFDNILYSLVSVFQTITLEGWSDIMMYSQETFSYFSVFYFLPLVFFGSYLILNLSIAVITSNFSDRLEKNMEKREVKQQSINFEKFMTKRQSVLGKENSYYEQPRAESFGNERETIINLPAVSEGHDIGEEIYSDRSFIPYIESLDLAKCDSNYLKKNIASLDGQKLINFATVLRWRCSSEYIDYIETEMKLVKSTQLQSIESDSLPHDHKIYLKSDNEVECGSSDDILNITNADPVVNNSSNSRTNTNKNCELYYKKYHDIKSHFKIFIYMSLLTSKKKAFFQLNSKVQSLYHQSFFIPLNNSEIHLQMQEIVPNLPEPLFIILPNYRIWRRFPLCYLEQAQFILYKLLETNYFGSLIIFLVIANVICLSLDYYGASSSLQYVLLQFNMLFTFFFFSEMLLKFFCYGPLTYCRNSMNLLDATVVILSLIEYFLLSGKPGSFNAFRVIRILRIFRILRVLKVFRYLKSMSELLKIISKSLSEFFYLFCLLILVCVIFSLLGMQIYGGNFNFPGGVPRGNFDNFNWAFVTIFQILSEENWNNVLVSSMMYQPYSCIFLITWIIIGNFVLLNIFLAILLRGFESKDLLIDDALLIDSAKEDQLFRSYSKRIREEKMRELQQLQYEDENSEDFDDEMDLSQLEHILSQKTRVQEQRLFEGIHCKRSFYIFSMNSPIRIFLYKLVTHSKFEMVIMVIIIASSIKLVFDTYILTSASDSREVYVSYVLDIVFTVLFLLEFVIKLVSFGFVTDKGSYTRDPWNILDMSIVGLSILDLSLSSIHLPMVKVIRLLRTLRPLRLISHNLSMKIMVRALISSIFAIVNILGIIFLIWLVFAILGVSLFAGKFYSCSNSLYITESDCISSGNVWINAFYNFDNVLEALATLFTISSQEAWPDRMYQGIDATGVGTAPRLNYNPLAAYYYIIYVVVGNFFLVNLFTAVVYDKFSQAKKSEKTMASYLLTADQQSWLELQELIVASRPQYFIAKRNVLCLPKKLSKFVAGQNFDVFMLVVIIVNTLSMAAIYQDASQNYIYIVDTVSQACTYIFIAEAVVKIMAFGLPYFYSQWNQFDFFVVCCSILNIVLDNITSSNVAIVRTGPQVIRVIRVLRISRMFKVFKSLKSIQTMMDIIWFSLPAMFNILSLMMLVFFMYAVLGSYLFYEVNSGLIINPYFNFSNFHSSLIILWRMSTGEDYPYIIIDCSTKLGTKVCILYFSSFVTLATFIFLDLFVSLIIQNYEEYEENHESVVYIFNTAIMNFKNIWNENSVLFRGLRLSYKEIPKLLYDLGNDLGVPADMHLNKVMKILAAMDLEVDPNGYVYYNDMLFAVMKRKYEKKLASTKNVLLKKFMRKEEVKIYKKLARIRVRAVRRTTNKANLGDKKINRLRIFMANSGLQTVFNAWKRFKDEKMGNDNQEDHSNSLYLE